MTSINRLMRLKARKDTAGLLLRYVKGPFPMPAATLRENGKHCGGAVQPRNYRQKRKAKRKAQKVARRMQRGQ